MLLQLGEGMITSAEVFFLTLLFALPLGLLVAFGRMSRFSPVRNLMRLYISIMRGTPLMLQLMLVYFGPYYLFEVRLAPWYRFVAVILGFSLNYAAYFAEIYRSGIEGIPKGQYEAAKILGYTRAKTFIRIILPQVIKQILPPVTNEVITLVKDTSLAFVIAISEMFTIAKEIAAAQTNVVPLLAAGVFYFIFNAIVAFAMSRIEKALSYYSAG